MPEAFRWLDFDLECRPLTYLGSDFTTADVTVIAWGWAGKDKVYSAAQTKTDGSRARMLKAFVEAYDQADGVTGHYIRGFDLPVINGALMELELPTLGDKLTCDTKGDLKKKKYISASQENLGGMLGLEAPKVQMDTTKWRMANRLIPEGIEFARERCIGDVVQHKQLRARLIALDMLSGPKVWRGGGSGSVPEYTP